MMQFRIVDSNDPSRTEVEELIRSVYRDRYNATIDSFPENLAVALSPDGVPVCAAGVRTIDTGFFSEIYLDHPVEQAIAQLATEPVARGTILEVTTLAALRPGAAFRLIDFIIANGRETGMRWGLFTATRPLRHALLRAGAGLIELARAEPHRVSNPADWGSYYDTSPFVCAISGDACATRAAVQASDNRMRALAHA